MPELRAASASSSKPTDSSSSATREGQAHIREAHDCRCTGHPLTTLPARERAPPGRDGDGRARPSPARAPAPAPRRGGARSRTQAGCRRSPPRPVRRAETGGARLPRRRHTGAGKTTITSRFTSDTRLVWSRNVETAHVGPLTSSHASSASATVRFPSGAGGSTVSDAATFCAARLVPRTGARHLGRFATRVAADEDAHLPGTR